MSVTVCPGEDVVTVAVKCDRFLQTVDNPIRYSELQEGFMVTTLGMTCTSTNEAYVVFSDETGFYIECNEGKHYLDGQIHSIEDDTLVGVYLFAKMV